MKSRSNSVNAFKFSAIGLLLLLAFQNCTSGFSTGSSLSSSISAATGQGGVTVPVPSPSAQVQTYTFAGKYLSNAFTLASDPTFAPFNSDFTTSQIVYADGTNGSDSGSGTSSSPFKTIDKARLQVQNLLPNANSNIIVVLRGKFSLTQSLSFTSADSGTNGHYVTYISDPQAPAQISGGVALTGNWSLVDQTKNMYAMSVGSTPFRGLFVNGVAAQKATSGGPLLSSTISRAGVVNCTSCGLPAVSTATPVEVVVGLQWQLTRCPAILTPDQMITMSTACASSAMANTNTPTKATWIENNAIFVTQPGQWALDSTKGLVYYIPRAGENLQTAVVEAAKTTTLVSATNVSSVAFSGIEFTESGWAQASSPNGFVSLQADVYWTNQSSQQTDWIPAAFDCESCQNVVILDSEFTGLGTSAMRFGRGSKHNLFFHNHVHAISGSGVQIGETQGSDSSKVVDGTIIEDNTIESVGQEYSSSTGILQIYAINSKIQHNDVFNLPYTGISVGWGWTLSPSAMNLNNTVYANHIYNGMQFLQDGGGVYTNSAQAGSIVAHNYMTSRRAGQEST